MDVNACPSLMDDQMYHEERMTELKILVLEKIGLIYVRGVERQQ
jgi:hypothetical protein